MNPGKIENFGGAPTERAGCNASKVVDSKTGPSPGKVYLPWIDFRFVSRNGLRARKNAQRMAVGNRARRDRDLTYGYRRRMLRAAT